MKIRLSCDADAVLWKVGPEVGDKVMASRVVLDAPARSNGAFLEVRDCTLKAEGLRTVGPRTAVDVCRIERVSELPGVPPKHDPQLEWCAFYDRNSRRWVIYRRDDHAVVVSTTHLELDCHAISSRGILHCHAEQLVDGRTNKDATIHDARRVKLRTLLVHDQTLEVEFIALGSKVPVI